MGNFNEACDFMFENEGGYVHNPLDEGGETKFGITSKTLDYYYRSKGLIGLPISHLTICEARQIYKELYWDKMKLDEAKNDAFATIIFDTAVNQGVFRAVKRLQNVLNYQIRGSKLTTDGILGPKTLRVLNKSVHSTSIHYVKLNQIFYVDIVKRKPSQILFLKGWINRTHRQLDLLTF